MNTVINPAPAPAELAQGASADAAIRTSSLDGPVRSLGQAREQTGIAAHELAESVGGAAQESLDAVRQRAVRLRDRGADVIREYPLQSVAIAAGTGAALALLVRALVRPR